MQSDLGKKAKSISLDDRSRYLRKIVVQGIIDAGRGHLGPSMSLIEILRVLYDDILNICPDNPGWGLRDRCILSKGHGCLALYAILADKGYFPEEEIKNFCAFDGLLGGHPEQGKVPGVEASTGALGHGLSIGLGMAMAARLEGRENRVFVILGDGESNEGSVWEAAMTASKHGMDNLVAVVDYNKFQSYGPTSDVLNMEPLAKKWESFGFSAREVNGHDIKELHDAFNSLPFTKGRPSVVIAHTVKGKGIPDAEYNASWHHKNKLNDDEIQAAYSALEVE